MFYSFLSSQDQVPAHTQTWESRESTQVRELSLFGLVCLPMGLRTVLGMRSVSVHVG